MSISKETQPPKDPEIAEETPPNINNNSNRMTAAEGPNTRTTVKATKANVNEVVEKLEKVKKTLTLTGDAGVGKTWLAKQASESALKKKEGIFYGTVWISVDQMHDETSLWESVARQLSLLTSADEWEVYVDDKKDEEDSEGERKTDKESVEGLRKQIKDKHDEKTEKAAVKKHLLLVLDGSSSTDDSLWQWLSFLGEQYCKFLVTRRESQGTAEREIIKVIPLLGSEALELFNTLGQKLLIKKETLGKRFDDTMRILEAICEAIEKMQKEVLPADIMRILRAIREAIKKQEVLPADIRRILVAIREAIEKMQEEVLLARIKRILGAIREAIEKMQEVVLPAGIRRILGAIREAIEKMQKEVLPADITRILGAMREAIEKMQKEVLPADITRILEAIREVIEADIMRTLGAIREAIEKQEEILPADIMRILGAISGFAGLCEAIEKLIKVLPTDVIGMLRATSGFAGFCEAIEKLIKVSPAVIMWILGALYYCIAELVELRAAIEKQNKVLPADIMRILGALYCIVEDGVPKLEEDLEDGVPKSEKDSEDGVLKLKDALTVAAKGLTEFVDGQLAGKDDGVSKLEAAIKAAPDEAADEATPKEAADKAAPNGLTKLLQIERKVLEVKGTIDYYWHIHDFFGKHGGVHYNELIVHWMLEGFINPVDYSRKAYEKGRHFLMAYEKGHNVLMKFVDYGLLRLQGDNNIVLQGPNLDLNDERLRGYLWKTNLRLPVALETDKGKGLGRIAPADGLIKTLRVGKGEELVATLLVDGSHLYREISRAFFKAWPKVRVLGIFDSTIKSFPHKEAEGEIKSFPLKEGEAEIKSFPFEVEKLFVLVLRSCHLLKDFPPIQKLKELTALEISGSAFLKEIPDGLFEDMPELRSLNLSELGIESLPNMSKLTKLQRLILRRCSHLRALPSIREHKDLVVLNLSGCSSLEKMADGSLGHLQELQIIDFSGVKLPKLPIIHPLKKLKQLLLEGCDALISLRLLKHLTSLKILHLTGVSRVREVREDWFTAVEDLRVLKLNGCTQIGRLPSTSTLKRLEYLDLSNASSLKDFEDKSFDHLEKLQYLNLSNTAVENLPPINGLRWLEHLSLEGCSLLESLSGMKGLSRLKEFILSGCKKLNKLPPLTDLQSLEDLDLSSCEALSEIPDGSFEHMSQLKQLNLTGCKMLEKLPSLSGLQSLENLVLSGCEALSKIQDDSFTHMTQLQRLNLSETQMDCLPSLPNSSKLCYLVLRSCKNLKGLPNSLPQLKELDLFGAANVGEIEAESLNCLTHLEILRLNNIKLGEFPSTNILTKLKEFSINGCLGIGPASLEDLTGLEVLELSGEAIERLPPLDSLQELRVLSLRGCLGLKELPSLKNLICLEVLDLSGTKITQFPGEIPEMAHLKRLHLPDLSLIKDFGWEKVGRLPGDLDWDKCSSPETSFNISETSPLVGAAKVKPPVRVNGTHFFKRLKDGNLLNNTSELFKQVIFSVHPSGKQVEKMDYYRHSHSDVYFQIRDFPPPEQAGQCFEIHGFDDYPTDIEDVLRQAEYVLLVENKFLNTISNLHQENLNSMKGCWVERCTEMTSIYKEAYADLKSEKKTDFAENLEILWISSLPNLRSFYEGNVQCFKNLKDLKIDSCPMLETMFSSNQLLENLQTLWIKYCGNLKTVFGQSEPSQGTEKNVHIVSARKLKDLHICHCHRLETIYPSSLLPEKLETVKIKFCDKLQSVFGNKEFSPPELLEVQKLCLSELPVLKTAGFKLHNRDSHKVRKCPKLQELQESNIPRLTNAPGEITEAGAS